VIGSDVGGGYDTYGRLLARHLGRFLPGNPNVVPSNMPGASGLRATNWLYNIAPKDGTVLVMPQNGTVFEQLLGNGAAQFDALKFNWIGSLNRVVDVVAVWHTTPYTKAEDIFEKQIIVSGSSGADGTIIPNLLNELAGTKFKVVAGYTGGSQTMLAVESGEVEGTLNNAWDSIKATKEDLLRDGKLRILMQIALRKYPALGDTPFIMDYVKSEENRQVLELLLAKLEYGRPFMLPPGVPEDVVRQMRTAFSKMSADPQFLAEAEKMRVEIDPTDGAEIQDFIAKMFKAPAPIVAKARDALSRAGAVGR
jgi:tripartite-type tricarboxylate transporter receptor subunit TctC